MSGIGDVGVVGGGFMGSGIAESAARAGLSVAVWEPDQAALQRSREAVERSIDRGVQRDKLTREEADATLERLRWVGDMGELAKSDLVIEAVLEDGDLKRELFSRLGGIVGDDVLLASNTSSIPIAQLAGVTPNPERVLGLHFFSPVPVMPLVEVVVGLDTAESVVTSASEFCRVIGKTAIQTKDRSGFIVNMLLVPYLMAAVRMYQDGFASREDIDEGMRLGCGHPMGPLSLADFIGLDVLYAIGNSLYDEFKQPEYAPPPLLKRMLATGRLGRKSQHGFYTYD